MNESMNKENGRIHRQRPLGNYSSYGNQIYEALHFSKSFVSQTRMHHP